MKTKPKNKPTLEQALDVLENLTVRMPIEFKTTTKRCTCNQFTDHGECRHTIALKFMETAGR